MSLSGVLLSMSRLIFGGIKILQVRGVRVLKNVVTLALELWRALLWVWDLKIKVKWVFVDCSILATVVVRGILRVTVPTAL